MTEYGKELLRRQLAGESRVCLSRSFIYQTTSFSHIYYYFISSDPRVGPVKPMNSNQMQQPK